ncbi:MAG: hypothetical protein CVT95_05260 [Bacteroidetes bacterium HGW-Bacteroidetes-12]|nr:MAG: hypothetical protein CVT95_05260 [Bacteroidetes bacterium HGW-Bacteroidetes-12]
MKNLLILFFFFFIYASLIAQDDEYIIEDPSKKGVNATFDKTQISNPDYTSYFLMPTAFTLKKKEIRLASTDLVFAKGSYGLSDRTTVSINLSAFTMLTLGLKHSIKVSEDITIAGTISGGQLLNINPDTLSFIGGANLLISFGDIQNNFSAGVGLYYMYSNFDFIDEDREITFFHFFIGAQRQISKKLYLVIDGIYFPTYQVYTGGIGVKLTLGKKISLGLGIMPIAWNDVSTNRGVELQPVAIPLLSFKMLLNKQRD